MRAAIVALLLTLGLRASARAQAPDTLIRVVEGRVTVRAAARDARLAAALARTAATTAPFPGLRPLQRNVLILVAPDAATFRRWVGAGAPEWGSAIAFPDEQRIVMQGSSAGSDAGDPLAVLRHELAHLALREALGDATIPRWFDEGYASVAAGEGARDELLATNVALVWRGVPELSGVERMFGGGGEEAATAYALARTAVAELQRLDPNRGLELLFTYWRAEGRLDPAIRRAYGMTATAFEDRWRGIVRRRFGALALVADLSVGAVLLLLVLLPAWVERRRRDRRRLEAMRMAEAEQERRDRESALAALLGVADGEGEGGLSPPEGPSATP
ncbi:MAG: hypothetical protein K2X99_00090 [Gemmatimonadaceae bacterium]|nr:hypothetical protein [Gemmatimonadaceae bacterium]